MSKKPHYPWPGNENPDCVADNRCGRCRKDHIRDAMYRRWKAGVYDNAPKSRRYIWTDSELALLRSMADQPVVDIVAAIKRTCGQTRVPKAVVTKAYKLGIALKRTDYSTPDLSAIFGVGHKAIAAWIHSGYLMAGKSSRISGYHWIIQRKAVEYFVRAYPWLYDLSAMDTSHPLFLIARQSQRGETWLTSKHVGAALGISVSHTRDLTRRGVLPGYRRGKWHMYRQSELPIMRDIIARKREELLHLRRTNPFRRPQKAA